MRNIRIFGLFAAFLGIMALTGPALAQPAPNAPPAPSTDPALSLQANATFLAENAKKPGVVRRPSGLQYRIIRNGFGKHPAASESVEVYYTGTLINGTVFDGTSPGLPASFNITASGLVQGWIEALQLMRVGDHWQVVIPAALAYGSRGRGPVPPNQTIIFDLRLLSAAAPGRGEPGYVPPASEQQQQQ
ncbi:MAG TPA: FKBP-type peptidyl-prolyl cis-trans isomerase [Rhizomicrobium sp.]|nr:FKBP-type peptidyl-prolyl cis-trans isomerase [Rhizomicrobium sp.]